MQSIISVIFIALLLTGCGKAAERPAASKPADLIIATVNGEPIYNKDIKLALALRLYGNPKLKITTYTLDEQLNLTINERLALQHRERSNSEIKIYDENLGAK